MQTYCHSSDIKELEGVLVSCYVNALSYLCASVGIKSMVDLAGESQTLMARMGAKGLASLAKDLFVCGCFSHNRDGITHN